MKKKLLDLCLSSNINKIVLTSNRNDEVYIFEILSLDEDEKIVTYQYYIEGEIPIQESTTLI